MNDGPQNGMIQLKGKNHRKRGSKANSGCCGTRSIAHVVLKTGTGPRHAAEVDYPYAFASSTTTFFFGLG